MSKLAKPNVFFDHIFLTSWLILFLYKKVYVTKKKYDGKWKMSYLILKVGNACFLLSFTKTSSK